MLCFLLKCLETAPAESMRKGTKKLAKKQKEMGFIFIFIADKQDLKKLFSYS